MVFGDEQGRVGLLQVCTAVLRRPANHMDPSPINRVYSLIFPENVSFGLSLVAGVVLPLQWFGDAVVYVLCRWLVRCYLGG